MPKYCLDAAMDEMLKYIDDADTLTVCSTEPTTYTEATSTYKLADVTLTPGDGNGDYTIGDGDSSGRKLRVLEQANVPIDSSGTANWVCLCLTAGSVFMYKTSCTAQALSAGGTVTVPAWDIEVADPT